VELRARGLSLFAVLVAEVSGLLGGVKSTSYALNMVAVDEARRRGADDALFLGSGGVVLECPTSNTWWRRDQTLFTPSLDLGILAGVTRGAVVEVATELGYEVAEGVYPIENLTAADEAFTTSSVREVMPVVAVDGRPIALGQAAKELQTGLRLLTAG
jgi:4-amino-4-deoxychorismate lyase